MSGQQSIIDNIISEAKERAKGIIAQAQSEAEAILLNAKEDNLKLNASVIEKAENEAKEIIARTKKDGELKARKKLSAARYKALEEAFERARKKILTLSDAEYLAFIKNQIKAYVQNNDKVLISARDDKRITADFISKVAKEVGVNLSLCKERGDFEGGVILKSAYWDSNLTIENMFRILREEFEAEVSKILLGEE